MSELEDQSGISDGKISIPVCFHASDDVIVMEDLGKKGYRMIEKGTDLGLGHLRLILDQLSRIHAFSYHYLETYPGGLTSFKSDMPEYNLHNWVPGERDEMEEGLRKGTQAFMEVFTNIIEEECCQRLATKIRRFSQVCVWKLGTPCPAFLKMHLAVFNKDLVRSR